MSVTADARRGAWPWSVMLLAGVAASLAVLLLTTHGVGLSPDSAVYLEAAGNLRQGRGLLVDGLPLIRYPPAYPAVIALVSRLFGYDAALAASRLQAALCWRAAEFAAACPGRPRHELPDGVVFGF